MGCFFLEGYGMIEVFLVVMINLLDGMGWLGIIGVFIFFIEVWIVDDVGVV